jgi:2,4-dienoyl-CoA reductase-like NADH-dependent reductase (Old Yellow Enzyme family)
VCPSENAEFGARALSPGEVEQLAEDFVAAAVRAEHAGFDGVELHCAHGYVLAQFLSAELNHRDDRYGGTLENRARIIVDIVAGIRARCCPDFLLGVRLSPERFGLRLAEVLDVARRLLADGKIDLLDLSLWDVYKEPLEAEFRGRRLLEYFTDLERGRVRLAATGKVLSARDAAWCLEAGADLAVVGRGAILHHDFPKRVAADPEFEAAKPPVTTGYLRDEGLGPAFIEYMGNWKGFVAAETA